MVHYGPTRHSVLSNGQRQGNYVVRHGRAEMAEEIEHWPHVIGPGSWAKTCLEKLAVVGSLWGWMLSVCLASFIITS
jgi:hypothetical protein